MTPLLSVVLYTRRGCHLCDDAKALLQRFKLDPVEVDVDADPTLAMRYGDCVPVVEINGRVRFRGIISPRLLRRIIAAET